MKKIIATILFLVTFFARSYGENFSIVVDNLPTQIEQLRKTAVLILVSDKKIIAGTGFLTVGNNKSILVITNKHIANLGRPIFVRVNAPEKVIDYSAYPIKEDNELDISILVLKKITPDQQWVSTDLMIPINMYGEVSEIEEGREIFYIGYPLGLGAEEKNYPVSRQGLIAQAIKDKKTFLVDGFASHGNSGSPVFSRKSGRLLGIVTSFEPDYIDSYENNKLIARVPFNSGLSRIISADMIKKLILDIDNK